jgi:hypothetical protein
VRHKDGGGRHRARRARPDAIADRTPPKPAAQFLLQIGLDVVFYAADGEAKHHLDK